MLVARTLITTLMDFFIDAVIIMAESNHESSTRESNLKKLFRGIVPHWPSWSAQGAATPIHPEAADSENKEACCKDASHLKRKSSLLRENNESDDSDYEETLPSCKRQRITVAAMSRLFAKFSLYDRETTVVSPTSHKDTLASSSDGEKSAIPENTPLQILNSPTHTTNDTPEDHSNNNDEDIPNMNKNSSEIKQVKCDTITRDSSEAPEWKRQKIEDTSPVHEENDENLQKKHSTNSEEPIKTNKRQADVNNSDTEENEEHASKVKRTRRLRRGLRLCTNITCYIEQVLYN
nr:uncharacterized protein LOC123773137 isoform X2 [Procambarus clarkii]